MAHRTTTQQHSRLEKKDIEAAAEIRRKGEQQGNQKIPTQKPSRPIFFLKFAKKPPFKYFFNILPLRSNPHLGPPQQTSTIIIH